MKQVGVAILISNKTNFKVKLVKKDGEGHFIFITGRKSIKTKSQFWTFMPQIQVYPQL